MALQESLKFNSFQIKSNINPDETIDLRLNEIDGEEGIFLCKNNYKSIFDQY